LSLRDYQVAAKEDAVKFFLESTENHRLYAAPTGVGKSYIETAIQAELGPGYWIITPRLDIARGFLQKRGFNPQTLKELVDDCWKNFICTPIRFRNALFQGRIPSVKGIIFDEGHHALATSWHEVFLASGLPKTILFTATPFRGTPKSTRDFREMWGEPIWIITYPEAAARGDISIPTFEILPLVDDDLIELTSTGEFDVTALESETNDRIGDMAHVAVDRWHKDGKWDRATCFCLPTVATAKRMVVELDRLGGRAAVVTAKTPDQERVLVFEAMKQGYMALVQVSVVGEGVDLPIRRLVDMAPYMSPVRWLQQFGRATRPTEDKPEYIVTNRNLQRHAYLLDGLCPSSKISEAVAAFGGIGERAGHRAIGLECLGKFKAANVRLTDGNEAKFYFLVDSKNGRMTEYACIFHPAAQDPIWASRTHSSNGLERVWGHWKRSEAPIELRGFVSQSSRPPSPKQHEWWQKAAHYHGLDPNVKLTQKNFAALPLLKDLGLRLAR